MVIKVTGLFKPVYPAVTWDTELKSLVVNRPKTAETSLGSWMFLFIDLILVALVSKCTRMIENCEISLHTIMFTTSIITVMYTTRLQLDDYCNRFYTNDLFHRFMYFMYMMCVSRFSGPELRSRPPELERLRDCRPSPLLCRPAI